MSDMEKQAFMGLGKFVKPISEKVIRGFGKTPKLNNLNLTGVKGSIPPPNVLGEAAKRNPVPKFKSLPRHGDPGVKEIPDPIPFNNPPALPTKKPIESPFGKWEGPVSNNPSPMVPTGGGSFGSPDMVRRPSETGFAAEIGKTMQSAQEMGRKQPGLLDNIKRKMGGSQVPSTVDPRGFKTVDEIRGVTRATNADGITNVTQGMNQLPGAQLEQKLMALQSGGAKSVLTPEQMEIAKRQLMANLKVTQPTPGSIKKGLLTPTSTPMPQVAAPYKAPIKVTPKRQNPPGGGGAAGSSVRTSTGPTNSPLKGGATISPSGNVMQPTMTDAQGKQSILQKVTGNPMARNLAIYGGLPAGMSMANSAIRGPTPAGMNQPQFQYGYPGIQ